MFYWDDTDEVRRIPVKQYLPTVEDDLREVNKMFAK